MQNLFYLNNVIHDVLYRHGFDEAAGNFQVNNFGKGGTGNDPVNAEAQDGSGTDNANFSTPADGSSPRMQMYLWTGAQPDSVVTVGASSYGAYASSFGGTLTTTGINGATAVYNDGTGVASDGCEASVGSLSGKIALIDRGTCNFTVKVLNAQSAGAGGVILINNTGGPAAGPAHTAKPEEFLNAFQQHLICNHHLAQACLEGMKHAGYGRIINIISTSVKQPLPNLGVSNTIRAAVANWAKTMANELGRFGITVNNVLPGATATQRLAAIIENKAGKNNLPNEAVRNEMLREIPMGRFAEAHEIAAAAAFLASPAAAYINGINLPVDGGRTGSL
mgnify:CR=1 FL=1